MDALSCGLLWAKSIKYFGDYGRHFPPRRTQKSSQPVRACATGDGAICSKNRKIVPYHGNSPNSRISARLRSPSLIMAPGLDQSRASENIPWIIVLTIIRLRRGEYCRIIPETKSRRLFTIFTEPEANNCF